MLRSWRFWILLLVVVIVAILAADWALASARLDGITLTATLETPSVIADGKHAATFVVQVTENGQPRAGDLLQIWLVKGSGQLIPQWAFLDDQGTARVTFTPVPYNRYDPQEAALVYIMDTSIGRLIEVGKRGQYFHPACPTGRQLSAGDATTRRLM